MRLKHNHPLAPYTSWRIGGPARLFYQPTTIDELVLFLKELAPAEQNIIWLGNGSNVLISDQGIDGIVIHTKKINNLRVDGSILFAETGLSCAKLAQYYPFLAGIPGTVGGALAMNAGAFGEEIWNYVANVTTINRDGELKIRLPSDFQISYRNVNCMFKEWFISSEFILDKQGNSKESKKIHELMMMRAATQPIGELTCGSVFKNPPGDCAARLIEACGLKGKQMGGAQVSPKHANFIVNKDSATAADVENLIELIKKTVSQQTGVELMLEVKLLGC